MRSLAMLPVSMLLLANAPRRSRPAVCEAGEADDDLTRKLKSIDVTGEAAASGASKLEKLQAEMEKRFEALGASTAPPPPPAAPPPRSAFTRTDSSAGRDRAEETLRLLRRKETGELEIEKGDQIARAQSIAQQWLDAGLAERASAELSAVEKFVSYQTDVGATYHLMLARGEREESSPQPSPTITPTSQTDRTEANPDRPVRCPRAVAEACGRVNEAKRLRQRIMTDALSSSQRWQAEKALEKASPSRPIPSDSSSTQEISKLWGNFRQEW
jgi:hypothetical protein